MTLTIQAIELDNWMRFRGHHRIELQPDAYAVVARHATDAERSNWLGKTSVLWAAGPFALYGVKPPHCRAEDDWITRGEREGSVAVVLSDGFMIKRTRKRGKATSVTVRHSSLPSTLHQAAAEAAIRVRVGMSQKDFFHTFFFEQKSIARLVKASPSERMTIIAEWLDLASLEKCHANAKKRLRGVEQAHAQHVAAIEHAEASITERLKEYECADLDELKAKESAYSLEAKVARAKVDDFVAERETGFTAQTYRAVVARGMSAKKQLQAARDARTMDDEQLGELRTRINELVGRHGQLAHRVSQLRAVESAEWDQRCPLSRNVCPVAGELAANLAKEREQVVQAVAEADAEEQVIDELQELLILEQRRAHTVASVDVQLNTLREQAKALKAKLGTKVLRGAEPPPEHEYEQAKAEAADAATQLTLVRSAITDVTKWGQSIAQRQSSMSLASRVATLRKAVDLFSRQGAQRTFAQDVLAAIEADANALLATAGIQLSITFTWRDTAASSRLELHLSDVSGAAEDLAGIAVQLAAAAWLKRERGSDWGVAYIDEPFGALDKTHRAAMVAHFNAMMGATFDQSLVVSHDKSITDGMPNTVQIAADETRSWFD